MKKTLAMALAAAAAFGTVAGAELVMAADRIERGCVDVSKRTPFDVAPVKSVYECKNN